jgi:glutamate-1-semialdehyde 2,1-aminomutase
MPGGVNSPVRSWKAVGGEPPVIAGGRGAEIFDADGRGYVDLVCSWGALVLGHAPEAVVTALERQLHAGTSFGAPTELETMLAERVAALMPCVEQLRLVSSGTEATMSALRLARAATGREICVKFAGCYHGHVDSLLVRAGSGALTLGTPDSPGVPTGMAATTIVAEYNDSDGVSRLLRERGGEIAAVIVEPVAGNMGVVPPVPGFLETLRAETQRAGTILVFDEVITGFRVSPGGAQERYGVRPDLCCLGKVLGGGMPLGAFGGRGDLMQLLAPVGPVYQAGTLSGNPMSVAAGLATLEALAARGDAHSRLEALGAAAQRGLEEALRASGVIGVVQRVGSMLTLFLGIESATDLASATRADTSLFARFFHGMMDEGFYLPPAQFEAWFVSLAHGEEQMKALGEAATRVLRRVA